MQKIILASTSPRRKEILKNYGIKFEVLVTDTDENIQGNLIAKDFVLVISKRKAEAAVSMINKSDNVVIIAADTVVAFNHEILGKPKDAKDAARILKKLSNDRHEVYTGLTLAFVCNEGVDYKQDICRTTVKFRELSDDEISRYIETGEPFDKAGAYGIQGQGGDFVAEISGDFDNVVGLPMRILSEMLCVNDNN